MIRATILLASIPLGLPPTRAQTAALEDRVPVLTVDGRQFRDLNRSGSLDRYEDSRLSPEQRADDLVRRMTLEEKAGTMMHGTLPGRGGGAAAAAGISGLGYDLDRARGMIAGKKITSFITRLSLDPKSMAEQSNAIQRLAEGTRLGIPVTISTDPRNHFQYVLGATAESKGFSQWPDALGFGAIGESAVVKRFGDIARREYRAVGIHMALSPQADLATEPRWSRATGTFGSSAKRVAPLVGAYVEGFQGGAGGLTADGVLTVVKHWVGYGAQPEGWDGHNHYGRFALLDEAAFDEHVAAFKGAFDAKVAGVMPTYPILKDLKLGGKLTEQVAAGFSKELLTGVLRGKHGFDGIIVSDWLITRDCGEICRSPSKAKPQGFGDLGMPWGVEHLTESERFAKGVEAGIDQFGGVDQPEKILDAVKAGRISEARLDQSVRRVMIAKFRQGLFDNPFVDAGAAARIAGNPEFQRAGDAAQRVSQVLLQNNGALPLKPGMKVFVHGMAAEAVRAAGFTPVTTPAEADVAILRMAAPFEVLHPYFVFGRMQHEGRLDYRDGDKDFEVLKAVAAARVPAIVSIYMDRPAILGRIKDLANVLLVNFGATDAALMDVITGKARAAGRLPFELPSSMTAVKAQKPGVPDDSAQPLYPAGFGLGSP